MSREENAAFISSIHAGINPLSILDAGRLIGNMWKSSILYSAGKTLGLSDDMACGQAVQFAQETGLALPSSAETPLFCTEVTRVYQYGYKSK